MYLNLVEGRLWVPNVAGSSPVTLTIWKVNRTGYGLASKTKGTSRGVWDSTSPPSAGRRVPDEALPSGSPFSDTRSPFTWKLTGVWTPNRLLPDLHRKVRGSTPPASAVRLEGNGCVDGHPPGKRRMPQKGIWFDSSTFLCGRSSKVERLVVAQVV